MGIYSPGLEDYFIESSIWIHILAFVVFDDMTQYWWHRLSHSSKVLWKLHRPHHIIEEMGDDVSSVADKSDGSKSSMIDQVIQSGQGGSPSPQESPVNYNSVAEAEAANFRAGTRITINGRPAVVQ